MSHSTTTLLGQQISSLLNTKALGRPLYYMDEVTSTNSLALDAAKRGAAHGTVFAADYQTSGRGRQGHTWSADAGLNLTFSIILDLPISGKRVGLLPLTACLGVADAIEDVIALHRPQLKWPNDILLNGQKVCGMLLQTVGSAMTPIILGIGINVNQTVFPEELDKFATSLLLSTGQPIDRAVLMASILLNLEKNLELMLTAPSAIRKNYTDDLVWIGQSCRVFGMDEEIIGTPIGIEESGALILETSTGTRTIYAGNVSLRMVND